MTDKELKQVIDIINKNMVVLPDYMTNLPRGCSYRQGFKQGQTRIKGDGKMSKKPQGNKVSDLEKVATEIADTSVRSVLALIGGALESALKTQVRLEDGSVRELTTREVLITLTNTIGKYLDNMAKADQERNGKKPKETN